jgi:hypothetical protein
LVYRKKDTFFSINFGHRNLEEADFSFKEVPVKLASAGLFNEQIDDESDGTAYHIPEGCLIVYDPANTETKNTRIKGIPTTAIAPSLLEHFNIAIPNYMNEVRIESLAK